MAGMCDGCEMCLYIFSYIVPEENPYDFLIIMILYCSVDLLLSLCCILRVSELILIELLL